MEDNSFESARFGTDCVHAEYKFDPQTGALMPPISLSTTFKQNYPGIPFSVRNLVFLWLIIFKGI
jgi:hypothetical protein